MSDPTGSPRDTAMGFTELKEWLRHRHPMVYLDRITEHAPGEYLKAIVSVSGTMDAISGHFPERAIFPGSHLMQGFAQAGIILYQLGTAKLTDDEITLIGSVSCRFMNVIVPGDRIVLDVRQDRLVGDAFQFSCRATVDERPVGAFRGSLVKTRLESLGRQLW